MRSLKLNELHGFLGALDFPLTRQAATDRCTAIRLVLADGEIALGDVVAASGDDRFESADDLAAEVYSLLPRRAVGEPFQSDGDA